MGGKKRAKQFFQKHTNSACKKMLGKKSSEKSAKKVFLYSHENRDQKMGGGKRAKQFFKKHTNSAKQKILGKKLSENVRKTFFYIHTNIVNKKWGEQNARNNFSRNTL